MMTKKEKKTLFLSKNLNYLLTQHAFDIKNLSLETGVPPATLSRLRKEDSNPTLSSIEPLLEFFKVDMDSFLYQDMSHPNFQNRKKLGDLVHISVYSLEEVTGERSSAKALDFIGAAGITGKNVFGVSINSDALAPTFQNNSTVILDPDLKPVEGDYALCCLGAKNNTPVFRQIFIDGKDYYFKSINPGFGDTKHYVDFTLLGIVIKSIESYR